MTAEGHLIFALASTILAKKLALTSELSQGDWWHVIAGGLLTCLLPDIDHPKSMLGRRLTWLSTPIARLFGHRGFTHSLLAIIASIIFCTNLPPPAHAVIPLDAFHAMIIGYLSHIAADMLTPAGVPLLWPCKWRFRVPLFSPKKGKKYERLLCIAALIFALQHPAVRGLEQCLAVLEPIQMLWQRLRTNR
ncbi:metal-dependent hydrolase [secondary endosymbiont of Ctenarytaina eucalypti]|uniref:Putative membrane-bound metal-dependent hydrolase n=1 Tax=secondary endosymbiont of Ctenarytaina eucalypti TaxID=1199245 RepID=J3TEW1_9ENTR|nr:metal-dependent hydrolase [secondary endosymbiont of Ctenarytaina eucalypti]AFP84442.1 putative membrane-bound metal-dependent hydrolase [secondary endosymbiont of Ctenarytaina eucalypti]